jgi:hypothetical protein
VSASGGVFSRPLTVQSFATVFAWAVGAVIILCRFGSSFAQRRHCERSPWPAAFPRKLGA